MWIDRLRYLFEDQGVHVHACNLLPDSLRRSSGQLAGVNLSHTGRVFAGGLAVTRVFYFIILFTCIYFFPVSSEHFLCVRQRRQAFRCMCFVRYIPVAPEGVWLLHARRDDFSSLALFASAHCARSFEVVFWTSQICRRMITTVLMVVLVISPRDQTFRSISFLLLSIVVLPGATPFAVTKALIFQQRHLLRSAQTIFVVLTIPSFLQMTIPSRRRGAIG